MGQYPLLPAESLGNANYEWRADLGGWRDKATNLVWGYSITDFTTGFATYSFAISNASKYPQYLTNTANVLLAEAADAELSAANQTDPIRRQAYLDLAARYRADSASTFLARDDAAKYSNWRIPTLAEYQAAWNKGLFARGAMAFNMDMAPFNGYQDDGTIAYWTADPTSKNKKTATYFMISSGFSGSTGVNSNLAWMVVRNAQ